MRNCGVCGAGILAHEPTGNCLDCWALLCESCHSDFCATCDKDFEARCAAEAAALASEETSHEMLGRLLRTKKPVSAMTTSESRELCDALGYGT